MQRWANRWGQRHPTAALVLSGLTFFVLAIGLVGNKPYAEIAPEWGTGPSVNEVVASYVLGMCLVLVLNRLVLRFATSGPVPMVTALDGERATLLKRGAKLFATQMAVVIGTALALGVLAWLGFRTGSVVVALLLAAGAAWSGSVVVPIVLRRYTPGGVWLTPNGFTDRHRGIEVTLAWDDVASAEFGVRDRMAVMGAPDLPVLVGTRRKRPYTVRYLAGIWKNPRRPMSKAVFLETRELAVNPGTLAHVVVHYARNRDERHELGTEESFTTLANLHDGSGDKRGFLPVSADPPKARTYPSVPKYSDANVRIREGEEPIEILFRVDKALGRAGASKQERRDYWEDATSENLDHLMATTRSWVSLVVE